MLTLERQARERDMRDTRAEATKDLNKLHDNISSTCKEIRKELQGNVMQLVNRLVVCEKDINKEDQTIHNITEELDKKHKQYHDELQKNSNQILNEAVQKLKSLIKEGENGFPRLEGMIA